jgi:hypothetical protein
MSVPELLKFAVRLVYFFHCCCLNVHTIIPVLRRLRQEDHEFGTILGYIAGPFVKKQNKKQIDTKTH